jgi:hypothetical protein
VPKYVLKKFERKIFNNDEVISICIFCATYTQAIQSRVIYLAWSVLDKTKQRCKEKRQRANANQATVSSF